MLRNLKALWHMPKKLEEILEQRVGDQELLTNGLTRSEATMQMIREVHNLITVKLEDFLKAENARIEAETMAKIIAHSKTITEKGENLKWESFDGDRT